MRITMAAQRQDVMQDRMSTVKASLPQRRVNFTKILSNQNSGVVSWNDRQDDVETTHIFIGKLSPLL